jgi:hypothetical protein
MRIERQAIALLAALLVSGVTDLAAQRRTTNGGGSSSGGTRQQPSGGGQRSSGGSSGGDRRSSGSASRGGERSSPGRRDGSTATRDGGRPSTSVGARLAPGGNGKIGAVRERARAARIRTSRGVQVVGGYYVGVCFDCSYWGWYRGYWGWYQGGWWYPGYYPRYSRPDDNGEAEEVEPREAATFGTTFLDYPYAGGSLSDATFIQDDAPGRRSYANLTGQYFGDGESQVEAGRFALEYGRGLFRSELAYSQYVEPIASGKDRMHVWRAAVGVQSRLTDRANIVAGVALRGVNLSGGDDAYGPEGELGLQVLPFRPVGINLNGRIAALSWAGEAPFAFRELNATGSFFVGRMELQAGWHYLKLGSAPAFTGPVAGVRVWF